MPYTSSCVNVSVGSVAALQPLVEAQLIGSRRTSSGTVDEELGRCSSGNGGCAAGRAAEGSVARDEDERPLFSDAEVVQGSS
mmetsp:Transcript_13847/g.37445  ORF Transcript_13847/g.37445 Transcript_13847/m.37445 type:complete len:82 (-) Transcript_13847:48-293(-)|eukprot:scaffold26294_cov30-Tisochrysis_lutea.AAC.6